MESTTVSGGGGGAGGSGSACAAPPRSATSLPLSRFSFSFSAASAFFSAFSALTSSACLFPLTLMTVSTVACARAAAAGHALRALRRARALRGRRAARRRHRRGGLRAGARRARWRRASQPGRCPGALATAPATPGTPTAAPSNRPIQPACYTLLLQRRGGALLGRRLRLGARLGARLVHLSSVALSCHQEGMASLCRKYLDSTSPCPMLRHAEHFQLSRPQSVAHDACRVRQRQCSQLPHGHKKLRTCFASSALTRGSAASKRCSAAASASARASVRAWCTWAHPALSAHHASDKCLRPLR